jgi:hypothetical protein
VKSHPWLKGVKWDEIAMMTFKTPYKPDCFQTSFDGRVSISDEEVGDVKDKKKELKGESEVSNDLFVEYYYNIHEVSNENKGK